MCPKSIEFPHFCSGWFVWFTAECAGRRGSWSDTNWNLSSTFPEYSCGLRIRMRYATKLGNTPKAIRMFLCGWVVHFMECISFQLHQIHFQSSSRPQVGPMLTESDWIWLLLTRRTTHKQTNRDISKLQAESYTQSGK